MPRDSKAFKLSKQYIGIINFINRSLEDFLAENDLTPH